MGYHCFLKKRYLFVHIVSFAKAFGPAFVELFVFFFLIQWKLAQVVVQLELVPLEANTVYITQRKNDYLAKFRNNKNVEYNSREGSNRPPVKLKKGIILLNGFWKEARKWKIFIHVSNKFISNWNMN